MIKVDLRFYVWVIRYLMMIAFALGVPARDRAQLDKEGYELTVIIEAQERHTP